LNAGKIRQYCTYAASATILVITGSFPRKIFRVKKLPEEGFRKDFQNVTNVFIEANKNINSTS
jgi:hypothetical protein